jgi:hypothetical protein
MKKRKFIFSRTLVMAFAVLLLVCCQKTTTTITKTTNDSASQATIASDELNVNNEIDQVIDEAVAGLGMCKQTSGGLTVNPSSITGAVIDTSQVDSGIVNIFYYGKESKPVKSRSGTVEIKLPVVSKHPVPWTTAGVTATVTFTNYEIFYLTIANKSLWFKGTFNVTSANGVLVKNLVVGDSLVEKVRGPVSFTYNDNGAILYLYLWNLHRTRILKRTATNDTTITTLGDTIINGINNVANWGMTRLSDNYYTSIITPVYQDISSSSYYNPLSGVKSIQAIPEPMTLTFGVNQSGTPIASSPFGYKMTWTNKYGAQDSVISY